MSLFSCPEKCCRHAPSRSAARRSSFLSFTVTRGHWHDRHRTEPCPANSVLLLFFWAGGSKASGSKACHLPMPTIPPSGHDRGVAPHVVMELLGEAILTANHITSGEKQISAQSKQNPMVDSWTRPLVRSELPLLGSDVCYTVLCCPTAITSNLFFSRAFGFSRAFRHARRLSHNNT